MAKYWTKIETKRTLCLPLAQYHIFASPCKVSDPLQLKTALVEAIKGNDYYLFKKTLMSNFIYPAHGALSSSHYAGRDHTTDYEYQRALTRPVIEALLIEQPKVLSELLDVLIASKNEGMTKAFLNCCKNSDVAIPRETFKPLNDDMRKALSGEFKALRKLKPQDEAQKLASSLEKLLTEWPFIPSDIKTLQYKMKFFTELSSYDKCFAYEPNYKKIFVNILTILSSAGLINLSNPHFAGTFLFFKQPSPNKQITNIKKIMNLALPEEPCAEFDNDLKPGDLISPIKL